MEKTYDFSLNSIFLRLLPRCQDFEREVPTENTRLRRHTVATEADQRESSGLQRGVEGREDPTGMPEAARDPNQSWMILLEEKQKKTFEKKKGYPNKHPNRSLILTGLCHFCCIFFSTQTHLSSYFGTPNSIKTLLKNRRAFFRVLVIAPPNSNKLQMLQYQSHKSFSLNHVVSAAVSCSPPILGGDPFSKNWLKQPPMAKPIPETRKNLLIWMSKLFHLEHPKPSIFRTIANSFLFRCRCLKSRP